MLVSEQVDNRGRIVYYDFIRGIAILFVIGIHTFLPVKFDSSLNIFKIVIRNVLNCAVPIFLAISGFFSVKSQLQNLKKSIFGIYFPMIFWSLPFFIIYFYNNHNIFKSLILLLFGCFSIYYYISLQIQCYFIFRLLNKLKLSILLFISFLLTFSALCLLMYFSKIKNLEIQLYIYAAPITTWIIFFSLGVFFAKSTRNYSIIICFVIVILALALSVMENYYWDTKGIPAFGIKISSMFFSISVLFFLFSNQTEKLFSLNLISKTLIFFGKNSFFIYLTHMYIIFVMNKVLTFNSWLIQTFCIIIFSTFFTIIVKKITPSNLKTIIGLKN